MSPCQLINWEDRLTLTNITVSPSQSQAKIFPTAPLSTEKTGSPSTGLEQKIGRTGDNLLRWRLAESAQCLCGEPIQTMAHILRECPDSPTCSDEAPLEANQSALDWISRWRDKIWINELTRSWTVDRIIEKMKTIDWKYETPNTERREKSIV